MEKEEQRFLIKYFWMKNWGSKKTYQERATTLGADAYGDSKSKSGSINLETGTASPAADRRLSL
jgi:hypothetical protein